MSTLLNVVGLEVRYHTETGTFTAIRNVNFDVQRGDIVGIVGESGCGKSTVALALMRLLSSNGRIAAGQILLNDLDLCQLDEKEMQEIRRTEMSMIFQDPMTSLNPLFTVEEQMVDGLRARGLGRRRETRKVLRERAIEMLDRVGIPDAATQIRQYPHQFSGGMRQRIMIANALLSNPSLLIADEPTSALDITLEAQILDLIRGLCEELGTAVLYITHDLGTVAQLCDRVIVMYAGGVVESGDVYSLFDAPKHPYTQALLKSHPGHGSHQGRLATIRGSVPSMHNVPAGCIFAPRCDYALEVCHAVKPPCATIDQQPVVCHAYQPGWRGEDPGRSGASLRVAMEPRLAKSAEHTNQQVVVETRRLRTHFSDQVPFLERLLGKSRGIVRAVDDVSITIRRGESFALVGESGSGKTTLARSILRLEECTDGEVLLEGTKINHLPESKIRPRRARIQMIFQDPHSSLSPRMKVSSLLLEPFRIHGSSVDERQKVAELLQMVGLSQEQADKYPHQLSGGQARRVGIARALALKPDILVADEPTAGLDVSVAAGILNLLTDLREEMNLTLLTITHNLSVVAFIADWLAVMYLGKIVELGEIREIFACPMHPYTEALLSAIPTPNPHLRSKNQRIVLTGEMPSPRNPPPGCPFHPRCHYVGRRCVEEVPLLGGIEVPDHLVACHFPRREQSGLSSRPDGSCSYQARPAERLE
jgi:peptide/nickel transport system ATP-binding protein